MALDATLYQVELDLADADRGVYEQLSLRLARHPSESAAFLATRLLAYALETTAGIGWSRGGLSSPEEPALHVRDDTGALLAWIEVGLPDAERLHRAAKAAPRVAVYAHRDPAPWLRALAGARIHRRDELVLRAPAAALVEALGQRLRRRTAVSLAVSGGHLYATVDGAVYEGALDELRLAD